MPSLPVSLAKQEVTAFAYRLLIDPYRFCRKGVSSDAKFNGTAQNYVTSCFARQTGSDSILLQYIDWSLLFSQDGGFRDAEHDGKIQISGTLFAHKTGSDSISLIDPYQFHRKGVSRKIGSDSILLPFIDWSVPFSQDGGFSGWRTQRWCPKFRHPVSLSKQEVTAFYCRLLIDLYCLHSKGYLGMPSTMVRPKVLSLPVLLA